MWHVPVLIFVMTLLVIEVLFDLVMHRRAVGIFPNVVTHPQCTKQAVLLHSA
jgi:hypothetical protein